MRAILRCTLMDGSTPLLCLVRWLRIMDDRHHEPTGMAMFEWDPGADGRHQYNLVAGSCIKCLIKLHPCLGPYVFVCSHWISRQSLSIACAAQLLYNRLS